MTSEHITADIDDLLDDRLEPEQLARVQAHLASCQDCEQALVSARRLRSVLSALPVSGPTPGFFDKAMQQARVPQQSVSRQRSSRPWMAAALAAGLVVMLVGGLLLRQPALESVDGAPAAAMASITMGLEQPRVVNLVFDSASPVENVILTVDLPMGVELAAYPGRMQMRWETSLQAGKNRLPLELIAIDGMGGELVATMQGANTSKVFRIDVEVVDG